MNKDIRISGDVEIHPTASLAPGVILQAASDSRIVIGADVCIGMGVIINACQGSVEIGDGAILGAGVLIIGESKIGNSSCIGTSTTIFRQNIAAMAVVEPGSIVGDGSRPAPTNEEQSNQQSDSVDNKKQPQPSKRNQNANGFANNDDVAQKPTSTTTQKPKETAQNSASIPQVETAVEYPVQKSKVPVVGQVYINELLITLFPHKNASDSSSSK
ncbi:MAG: hypothetical protein WBM44_16650 [Waterburya sp.]